ncbi:MAG: tryptophan-rich sensory protein [Betaproteobacteria bacterium]|nr:tryptophan-rich sensory protein [Betaproteobacteria bacterium]
MRDYAGLAAFIALNAAVSALGGWATASSVGTWYPALAKPAFNPPDWIFAPVWSALYLMIAIAGWRVWRRGGPELRGALTVYAVQLALNLSWSFVFFGAREIGAALAVIAALLAAILVNAFLFWRIERAAGALLAPYAAWVAFAMVLNAALWRLN